MTTMYSILALGFFLGMKHATDADHVMAVTTIVTQQRGGHSASLIGALWGIGHSITILVVGSALVLFGLVVPQRLGLGLDLSVAIMLVMLGAANIKSAVRAIDEQTSDRRRDLSGRRILVRPLIIGLIHGLGGSAALALLVLPVIKEPVAALVYLFIFGVGTVSGMMLITSAMAAPLRLAAAHSISMHRYIGGFAGAGTFCFGLFLVYQIGWAQRLFFP
jgi:high-affinity nickel-transport protein